jgi:hypothetical protein
LLAHLAGRFDPGAKEGYEEIFTAWGGDVRERAVDIESGVVRPREVTVEDKEASGVSLGLMSTDPTIYARVDYLDAHAKLTAAEKAACKAVLKNLPVIFTFAPMNLLHYRVAFEPGGVRQVVVKYSQHAYRDTRDTPSYQLAYVVHPASLWDTFGPIALTVRVPRGVPVRVSALCREHPLDEVRTVGKRKVAYTSYTGTVDEKTGELFVGIGEAAWKTVLSGGAGVDGTVKTARR